MGPAMQWEWNVLYNKFLSLRLQFCRVIVRLKVRKQVRSYGWARRSHRAGKGKVTMYSPKSHRKQDIPVLDSIFWTFSSVCKSVPILKFLQFNSSIKKCLRVKSHIPYMMNLVSCLETKNFGKYRDVQGLDVCRKQKNPKQKHLNSLLERKTISVKLNKVLFILLRKTC